MKHLNAFALCMLLTCAAFFVSCEDDKEEETKPIKVENKEALEQDVYADNTSGNGVTFTTATAWTSSIKAKTTRADSDSVTWVSISPKSGSAGGTYTVNLNLKPNLTGQDRSATITIVCADADIEINVSQKAIKEDGKVMVHKATFSVLSCNEEWSPENETPYLTAAGAQIAILKGTNLVDTCSTNANGIAEVMLEPGEYTYTISKGAESNLYNNFVIAGIYTSTEEFAPEGDTPLLGGLRLSDLNGDGVINDQDKVESLSLTIDNEDVEVEAYIASADFTPSYRPFQFQNIFENSSYRNMATKAFILDAGITREAIYNNSPYNTYNTYSFTAQDSCISVLWNEAYNIINIANATLEQVEITTVLSEMEKNYVRADAFNSRMYAYSILLNYFGAVPIYTESGTKDFAANPTEDVEHFVLNDADNAANYADNQNGWKSFAQQIKARIYMRQGNFQQAYETTKEIIDSGKYALGYTVDTNGNFHSSDIISFPFTFTYPYPAELKKWSNPQGLTASYRETLLTNAEAANELGRTNEALQIINMFRDQAGLGQYNYLTQEEGRGIIINLWKEQLKKEGQTFGLLKRTGTFMQTLGAYGATEKNLLLPKPQSALDANPNLVQNPGWN